MTREERRDLTIFTDMVKRYANAVILEPFTILNIRVSQNKPPFKSPVNVFHRTTQKEESLTDFVAANPGLLIYSQPKFF